MKFNGKALNEWMREGLLKKELEVKLGRPLTENQPLLNLKIGML